MREQRSVIARLQLAEAVSSDLHVPGAMREAVHRYTTERRAAAYLMLPPSAAGEIPAPTEEELKALYEANKSGFRAPEFRCRQPAGLDPEAMAKPDAVTPRPTPAPPTTLNKARYGTPGEAHDPADRLPRRRRRRGRPQGDRGRREDLRGGGDGARRRRARTSRSAR